MRARDVDITEIDGAQAHRDHLKSVVFCAIPMGWTHTLAVCQAVLKGLARQAEAVTADNALVDRQLVPDINPMIHTECADNFESYAYDEKLVATAAREVESRLNDAGLPTRDAIVTRGGAPLGWHDWVQRLANEQFPHLREAVRSPCACLYRDSMR